MNPVFLTLGEILAIHRDQINRYGGVQGIRDITLLQSALAMPAAGHGEQYFHIDLYEMAAAYLFHITQNHPFIDGNKRVGAVSSVVFLSLNGIEFNADENSFEKAVRAVAEGKWNKSILSDFFRNNSRLLH